MDPGAGHLACILCRGRGSGAEKAEEKEGMVEGAKKIECGWMNGRFLFYIQHTTTRLQMSSSSSLPLISCH